MIGVARAADEQQDHEDNEHDSQSAQSGQHQLLVLLVEFQHLGHPLGAVASGLGLLFIFGQHLVHLRLQNVPTGGGGLAGDLPESVLNLPLLGGGVGGRLRPCGGLPLHRIGFGRHLVGRGRRRFAGQIVKIQIQLFLGGEGLLSRLLGGESFLSGKSFPGGKSGLIQGQLPGSALGSGLPAGLPGQIPVGLFNLPLLLPVGSGAGKFSL